MRFTLVAIAALAVAMASSSVVRADASAATDIASTQAGEIADEAIQFVETGGDKDFEDEDEDVRPVRRNKKKHHHRKHKHHKSTHYVNLPEKARLMCAGGQVTWYASHDLQNPQCGDGKWNPTNNAHIGAVMYGWENGPKCGEFVYICNEVEKCIRVRIVDKCAGCKQKHIDLTKSAFKQVDPKHSLDTGVVRNLKVYYAPKPSPWDLSLFGPLHLK